MVPRQEIFNVALLVTINDGGERPSQVAERIDSIELAGLYEGRDGRPVLRCGVVPGEESILTVQGYRSDGSLDGVVVDLDAPVSQEDAEPIPVFGDIGESFAERRLASDRGTMMREPGPHVCDQRR